MLFQRLLKMSKLFCALALSIGFFISASGQDVYFIGFTNKIGSSYSVNNPAEFLSQRSVDRRNRQGVAVNETDLPVSPQYISEIRARGAQVRYSLRWFNGVVAMVPNPMVLNEISQLDFVNKTIKIFDATAKSSVLPDDEFGPAFSAKTDPNDYYSYGGSSTQVKMMNGHKLHNLGFRGQGMLIALLDAGFKNVNTLSAFDSLWFNNRIVYTRDFVNRNSNIFNEHPHGTIVLSAMAGNIPGQLIGTAPEAHYVLIRTEDAGSEQIIEEYNWAAGAELADSLGVDLINSSLGYYQFDVESQNHSFSNLDGQSTPSARAANMAFAKGMLVVASAGNEGGTLWQKIITPSDAFGAISVGAVDNLGNYVSFSSIGPSADGRIKPEVAAMGKATVVQNSTGNIATANGTSLSAPLVSGLAACLWQKYWGLNANEIREMILLAGSIYSTPNAYLGYGIPNFGLYATGLVDTSNTYGSVRLFPNPTDSTISFVTPNPLINKKITIRVFNASGGLVDKKSTTGINGITQLPLPADMTRGLYLIYINSDHIAYTAKFVKGNN